MKKKNKNFYQANVVCHNCNLSEKVNIPFATTISGFPCPNCKCHLLVLDKRNFINPKKEKLYYQNSLIEIRIGDIVGVQSSEFCVTNADKIIYDERISGQKAEVLEISLINNTVTIKLEKGITGKFFVHPTWIDLYSRKLKKVNEKTS